MQEKLWLEQWYLSFEWSKGEELPDAILNDLKGDAWKQLQQAMTGGTVIPMQTGSPQKSRRTWWYYSAAAIIIVTGTLFFFRKEEKKLGNTEELAQSKLQQDVQPGTSKASLVLHDGSVVTLDSVAVTQLRENDGTTIDKQYGKIVYNNAKAINDKVFYNTLNTPRGAEYQLVLPDGSKVWLNAASSLRFPTRFTERERVVSLKGEAYFEIAKNPVKPFRVVTDEGMDVEVTGTHFNIMAYADEEYIKTTLTEGKVRIRKEHHTIPLSPSEQATLQKNTQQLNVKEVDVDKEIAWKNGMIEFNEDDLPYIMRQLSRWYDVDVSFEGIIPQGRYNGSIPRRATLSEVMQILRLAGVKYWMDNKKIVITEG